MQSNPIQSNPIQSNLIECNRGMFYLSKQMKSFSNLLNAARILANLLCQQYYFIDTVCAIIKSPIHPSGMQEYGENSPSPKLQYRTIVHHWTYSCTYIYVQLATSQQYRQTVHVPVHVPYRTWQYTFTVLPQYHSTVGSSCVHVHVHVLASSTFIYMNMGVPVQYN